MFESMELKVQSSQVKVDLEKSTKDLMQQANIMKEESKKEVRSRNICYSKRKKIAFKSPAPVGELKLTNKCDECSFMTPFKESSVKLIKHHKDGFKCGHIQMQFERTHIQCA